MPDQIVRSIFVRDDRQQGAFKMVNIRTTVPRNLRTTSRVTDSMHSVGIPAPCLSKLMDLRPPKAQTGSRGGVPGKRKLI